VSNSPRARRALRTFARTTTFFLILFSSIVTSTAVVGLDPNEAEVAAAPALVSTEVAVSPVPVPDSQFENDECSAHFADFCVEVPVRRDDPEQSTRNEVASCSTGNEHQPSRSLQVVPAAASSTTSGAIRVRIELEAGLAIDGGCFADEVMRILNDPRGWGNVDDVSFRQIDDSGYDLRLILASPERTDALCSPARTAGRFSCRKQSSVILNLMRWETGTDEYSDDLSTYRTYLVNHEVGHFLGRGHLGCPGPGELAPVMMQQTKGLGECAPNGWPTKDED
jgi:hypothetical protein